MLTALNTSVTYTRDLRDAITQRVDTTGASRWYQWYDYDSRGLLWKGFAATTATKPGTADVTYTYRPGGQVASRTFAGGPTVPYAYTIREQLARIGDPATATYPFSAAYGYQANGAVSTAEFYSAGSPAAAKRYRYQFPAYDALGRLQGADFSSWSGSAWTSTLAHDVTGLTYDASGNLTGLRRYRETGTLVDQLTYTTAAASNRLQGVADAVGATGESWDAESGSFTYDANGNVQTTPGPWSLTGATYDAQNLPLSVTRGGTTTAYRYDAAGQRIAKQVASGSTEVTVREGALALGVFTVTGAGAVTASTFHLLAGDRVVGRQPGAGSRRYYHTDLLGSTRAVVAGATVVESYDYDPWGVLLPGRTLGSGTAELFTGKERDAESGLDYFGARYYLAALGRWAQVDPALYADRLPAWSPYVYVSDAPTGTVDPDGRCPKADGGDDGRPCELGDIRQAHGFWLGLATRGWQEAGISGRLKVAAGVAASTLLDYSGATTVDESSRTIADPEQSGGAKAVAVGKVGLAIAENVLVLGANTVSRGIRAGSLQEVGHLTQLVRATGYRGSRLYGLRNVAGITTRTDANGFYFAIDKAGHILHIGRWKW